MARSNVGGFSGPIEGLPELIAACNGRESVFASMVSQELHPTLMAQVRSQTLLPSILLKYLNYAVFKKMFRLLSSTQTHTVLSEELSAVIPLVSDASVIPNYSFINGVYGFNLSANCRSNESIQAQQHAL